MLKRPIKNGHERKSTRLQGYDYSLAGLYFVTLCTKERRCLFGNIINNKMDLNEAGEIAQRCWVEIPQHFPNALIHEFVIMPNHVHGIIELGKHYNGSDVRAKNISPLSNHTDISVGANNYSPLPEHPNKRVRANNNSPQPINNSFHSPSRTIGSIVRGFKIGVTKWFRENTDVTIVWQRNYHDHIIRDYDSYRTISEYIINNPARWDKDKFFLNESL